MESQAMGLISVIIILLSCVTLSFAEDSRLLQYNYTGPQNNGTIFIPFRYRIEADGLPIDEAVTQLEDFSVSFLEEIMRLSASSVQLLSIASTEVGSCSSNSTTGACSIWESVISLALESDADKEIVERAVREKIQNDIFDSFNKANQGMYVTLIGPFYVTTEFVLILENVKRIMNGEETRFLEQSVMEVLNLELEKDGAVIFGTTVFLQVLRANGAIRRHLEETTSNEVFIRVEGQCNRCSSQSFGLLTNDAVGSSSNSIKKKLKDRPNTTSVENGEEDYFENVEVTVAAGVADQSETAPSLAPRGAPGFPYWILYALAGGVFVVISGVFVVAYAARKQRLLEIAKLRERPQAQLPNSSRQPSTVVSNSMFEARQTVPTGVPPGNAEINRKNELSTVMKAPADIPLGTEEVTLRKDEKFTLMHASTSEAFEDKDSKYHRAGQVTSGKTVKYAPQHAPDVDAPYRHATESDNSGNQDRGGGTPAAQYDLNEGSGNDYSFVSEDREELSQTIPWLNQR